jgi:hypothetical protein
VTIKTVYSLLRPRLCVVYRTQGTINPELRAMTNELSTVWRDQAPDLTRDQAEPSALGQLEVNVIFTDPGATASAFRAATTLATDLDACIRIRAAIAVPFCLPLDRPQVSVPFAERALAELVSQAEPGDVDVTIHLYLSRDRIATLLQVLQPNSLVIMAGRKRLWPTAERRIANSLRSHGHRVVFIPLRSGN